MSTLFSWTLRAWLLIALTLGSTITTAEEHLKLGVFAYLPKPVMEQRFQPLANYLSTQLDQPVDLVVLDQEDMEAAVNAGRVDLLLTNPSHYLIVRNRSSMVSVLATVVSREKGQEVASLGGVIVTLSDRADIQSIRDLERQRIGVPGMRYMGGFQTQALELLEAGVSLPQGEHLLLLGTHDRVIDAVLEGRVDAGFVRTGVIEHLVNEGKLDSTRLKVIHPQQFAGFPYRVSTRLYPEWPVVALMSVDRPTMRRLSVALLALDADHPAARAAHIGGFVPPADYTPVEQLARRLRMPPYDTSPEFTLADVWTQYRWGIVMGGMTLGVVILLLMLVAHRQRALKAALQALDTAFQERENLAKQVPGVIYQFRLRADGTSHFPYASKGIRDIYGVTPEQVMDDASRVFEAIHPDDVDRISTSIQASARTLTVWHEQYRVNLPDGRTIWVEGESSPEARSDGSIQWHGYIRDITERVQVDQELRDERRRLNDILVGTHVGTWEWNVQTGETIFNERWAEIIGYRLEELRPISIETWMKFTHPDDLKISSELLEKHFRGEAPYYECEARMRHRDGHWVWILDRGKVATWTSDGKPLLMSGTHQDITQRKQADQALRLAANVFSHAREGILITDREANIVEVNQAFVHITGYSREEVLGKNPRLLNSGRQDKDFYAAMFHDLQTQGHWHGELWNRRKDGNVYAEMLTITAVRDGSGEVQNYIALFSDITPLKEHQAQLEHIAHYDALTRLPNRWLLADRLKQGMRQASRRGQLVAVVYLDLDGFKAVNDIHGHEVGDQLLIGLAHRMSKALREGDTLARIGGDEFVGVLVDLPNAESCTPTLQRLLHAAAEAVYVGDLELHVSASIGVSIYPQAEEVDPDQLVRQADQAMYQAKQSGKNRYHIFDAEQDRSVRGRHESLERIRQALKNHEFVLYYQPKVHMQSGEVLGAEALIRWQHPERGLLPPAAFLPVIENHPLAVELGEWVLDNALTQIEAWHGQGLSISVSVNVGALELQHPDFVSRLHTLLDRHPGVRAQDLELEILETSALEDFAAVSRVMATCQEMGIKFSVDDFGTGYSSLTYLKRLPAATLKIDQSFVRDMLDNPEDLAILKGLLGLAEAFNRQVIAEGVETPAHGEMLLRLGCTCGQGYAIARPMPAQDLPRWAMTWTAPPSWNLTPDFSGQSR